jgi:hypothetical protein
LIHSESWKVEDLIIRTHKVLSGKHLLINSKKIEGVDWRKEKVILKIHSDELVNAPEYKPTDSTFQDTHTFG